jgi:hypothetical protein
MKFIKTCPFCNSDFESEGTPDTLSNEMLILRAFVKEFHPFYNDEILSGMNYNDLILAVKEISEEL